MAAGRARRRPRVCLSCRRASVLGSRSRLSRPCPTVERGRARRPSSSCPAWPATGGWRGRVDGVGRGRRAFFFVFGVDGAAAPKPPAAAGFFFADTVRKRRSDDVCASRQDAGINAASSATVRRACITAGVLWLSRAARRLYFESQIDARAREMRQRLDSSETER